MLQPTTSRGTPSSPGAEAALCMPRMPIQGLPCSPWASLPAPSTSASPQCSSLVHKSTPPSKCFDSHWDQVYQLVWLPVLRLPLAAVTWLRRHNLITHHWKAQITIKQSLSISCSQPYPSSPHIGRFGEQRLSFRLLTREKPAAEFSAGHQSP